MGNTLRYPRRLRHGVIGLVLAIVAQVLLVPLGSNVANAATFSGDRHDVWDLGRDVETWGPEVRVSLGYQATITAVTVKWSGSPVDIARIEISNKIDDSARTVVASGIDTGSAPRYTRTFATPISAHFVSIVLAHGTAAGAIDRITLSFPDGQTVRMSETFESGKTGQLPSDWVGSAATGTSVQSNPSGSGKVLRFVHSGANYLRRDFTPSHDGIVRLKYRLYAAQTNETFGTHVGTHQGSNNTGSFATSVYSYSNGKWRTNVGSTTVTGSAYTTGRWYNVEVTIHAAQNVFDLKIDGTTVVTRGAVRNALPIESIGAVFLNTFGAGTGTVYYDDITVTTEPGPDREFAVPTTEGVQFPYLGSLAPRPASQISDSPWSVGGETLDRDVANYDAFRPYLASLGAKRVRLQAGWAKTEKQAGVYNFAWLDKIINDVVAQGLVPWVELSYGNPIYSGGGSTGIGSIPTSATALKAWDAWVKATVQRYKNRVPEWEIWNEPNGKVTAQDFADFHIRTAQIVRSVQPNAKIIGVAASGIPIQYIDNFLARLASQNKLSLVNEISYHPYSYNPDSIYPTVSQLQSLVSSYASHIRLRQGENGAPIVGGKCGALNGYPWTEVSKAKWDARRLLGDFAHGVANTNIFQMMDLKYSASCLVPVGLLEVDLDTMTTLRVRQSYRAVQSITALLDSRWTAATANALSIKGTSRTRYATTFKRNDGQVLGVAWYSDNTPQNSIQSDLVTWQLTGSGIDTPVFVDIRTGRVYAVPADAITRQGGTTTITAPLSDSPIAVMDAALLRRVGTVRLTQDFESEKVGQLPSGWVGSAAAGTSVQANPAGSGKVLRFPHNGTNYLRRDVTGITDNLITMRYRVYLSQTTNTFGAHIGLRQGPNAISSLSASAYTWNNGKWRTNVGASTVIGEPYTTGHWYDVELTVHQADDVFDLTIDGVPIVSRGAVRTEIPRGSIGAVFLNAFGGSTGTAYYDNIVVTSAPGPDPTFTVS